MQKRYFETYQKRFRDFEILPKFSETHVFRVTIRHPGSYAAEHSYRYCLRYRFNMRTKVAGNRGHVSLYRRHGYEVDSSSTSQACRKKTCDAFCCRRRYVLIYCLG